MNDGIRAKRKAVKDGIGWGLNKDTELSAVVSRPLSSAAYNESRQNTQSHEKFREISLS
ncbi:MAG: hypothetical protein QOJ64_2429 [Acidobacteriota bacterium]|jgi:hypothetical protein|nr:hypothetical protein [Acidobacteriota bacterium]